MGNRNYYHWNSLQKEKDVNDKQTLIKLEKEVRELKGKLKKQSDQKFWEKVAIESLKSLIGSLTNSYSTSTPAGYFTARASEIADLLLKEKQERDFEES